MDKLKFETPDMVAGNIDKIAALFPAAITEMRGEDGEIRRGVNFEVLRQLLSRDVVDGDECYEFTWVGKKAAMAEAARPITKTLRPVKEDSRDWDTTENLYIEGDNLEVLKLLQESYLGKVKMIYIDPPYNTGSDFVYRDNFHRSQKEENAQMGMDDEDGNRLFQNSESNGRFHSDWCSMIYARLTVARNLLSDDGVIFISIDDKELTNLKKICDDTFGVSNFVADIIWQSTAGSNTGTDIVTVTENILIYTKQRSDFTFDGMLVDNQNFTLSDEYEAERGKYSLDKLDRRRVGTHYSEALNYGITMPDGSTRFPGGTTEKSTEGWNYLWSKSKVEWGIKEGFIEFKKVGNSWNVYNKRYARIDNEGNQTERTTPFRNLITSDQCNTAQGTAEIRALFEFRPFDFPKPSGLVKHLMNTAVRTTPNAIVLDFFSGSATTAHAVMQLNAEDGGHRKFIMVQLPEKCDEASEAYKAGYKNICEIGKERIRRAGNKIKTEHPDAQLDTGFRVFRVDESNMENVYYHPEELTQTMLGGMVSNIKSDRSDLDLLYACLLDWGVEINLPHSVEKLDGYTIHNVDDGALVACFDENVPDTVIRRMADLHPLRAVFRDSSFASDDSKINVTEIFKNLSPDTNVKVI